MENNRRSNPLIDKAFQALLGQHRATYLLIDRQNHLLHICGDALDLIAASPATSGCQDILERLPASLQLPVSEALQQAQVSGTAQRRCSIEILDGEVYGVTIDVCLQPASQITEEFLTLLITQQDCDRALPVHSPTHADLTPLTALEITKLLEVNQRLRAEILERQQTEQKLVRKAEALARSNADLEEFAYVVSHDLQEPLRAMTAFSQLLGQRYHDRLDETAKRYIKHIVDGGTRMKAMIDGILELSRINNIRLNNSPTSLDQALETVLENLKLIRLENQATITHDPLPTLYVDQNYIVQLLQNLISNAIKFRGPESPRIHITAEQQTNRWLFSVHDNGIGIPQDQQKRIFKLFQRLHNQQEQKGYGIGLAICKKIVEHYQGSIWLQSAPEQGSIVYFTLVVRSHTET
ncbi:response regulator receiver sensor signal transduction histidine kinase [Leptolyngbya sp. Heron Island J]|uniref:sensor histidine kinase n=1 Tax=Leptolyngbya sp. Heron Island J TaxID=1385935 RepID=UPI0003B9F68B|nr:ATP-binding protein [Leptolyngbya sp. Heron Island J]ESA35615.1 response regulator receiver sensor signal transduction histidine kinase [Leptolyngbya sp. Heron Island J]